jgi:Mn2+/Fe2+ NRAMP family transporter
VKRLLLILFWSVIAAAFIGPGTVTTCAAAGSRHRFSLLWALLFSTVACIALQEASARITAVTGHDLGQAIRARFRSGPGGILATLLVLGAVVIGCAAYEAGNILGAVAGATLLDLRVAPWSFTLAAGGLTLALLWFAATGTVARLLGIVVAVMGVAFLATAATLAPPPSELLRGLLLPSLPSGSALVAIGLIGTTVVPYNLFLGSGLARGQTLREIRLGIGVAVTIGGLISMAVVVVGTAVSGTFGFESLAAALAGKLGGWAVGLLAVGLFAAGFSSAMTAPLAAAITARSLLGGGRGVRWTDRSWRFRSVWIGVLLVGVAFGLSGVRPIPAILLAQVLNGILLPLVAAYLMVVVNDREIMGRRGANGVLANTTMGITVAVTAMLGTGSVLRGLASAAGKPPPGPAISLILSGAVAILLGAWILSEWLRARRREARPGQ